MRALALVAVFLLGSCSANRPTGAKQILLPPTATAFDRSALASEASFVVQYWIDAESYTEIGADPIDVFRVVDGAVPALLRVGATVEVAESSVTFSRSQGHGEIRLGLAGIEPGVYLLAPSRSVGGGASAVRPDLSVWPWPDSYRSMKTFRSHVFTVGSCPHVSWERSIGDSGMVDVVEYGLSEAIDSKEFAGDRVVVVVDGTRVFPTATVSGPDSTGEYVLALAFATPVSSQQSFSITLGQAIQAVAGGRLAGGFGDSLSCAPADFTVVGTELKVAPNRNYRSEAVASSVLGERK